MALPKSEGCSRLAPMARMRTIADTEWLHADGALFPVTARWKRTSKVTVPNLNLNIQFEVRKFDLHLISLYACEVTSTLKMYRLSTDSKEINK